MDPKHSLGPDRIDYRETPEDLSEVHAAILRENPEPSAAVTPIPLWLISICGVAVAWAGAYLGMFNGGFRGDIFNERFSNPNLLFGVAGRNGAGSAASAPELSLADQGKKVYGDYCVTCHQPTGMGAPGQYPPLSKSEYVNGGDKRMIAIILKGIQGSFSVEGAQYNNQMPTWELTLSDKKIAAVATFVRSSFGNSAPEVTPAKVAAAKKEFAGQTTPWTADGIAKIPADAMLPDEGGSAAPAKGAPASGGAAPAPAPAAH